MNRRILILCDEGVYQLIDFYGQILKSDFDQYQYEQNIYFSNGSLIFRDYQTIYSDNLNGNQQLIMSSGDDSDSFAFINNNNEQYLYIHTYDDELQSVKLDGKEIVFLYIDENIENFYLAGNQIVYYMYDDYNNVYYLANDERENALLK
ncbi:MAG: hypothetical protein ACI4SR_08730 [Faecalibacillus sp.]